MKPINEPFAPQRDHDHQRMEGVSFLLAILFALLYIGYIWVDGYNRGNPAIREIVRPTISGVRG